MYWNSAALDNIDELLPKNQYFLYARKTADLFLMNMYMYCKVKGGSIVCEVVFEKELKQFLILNNYFFSNTNDSKIQIIKDTFELIQQDARLKAVYDRLRCRHYAEMTNVISTWDLDVIIISDSEAESCESTSVGSDDPEMDDGSASDFSFESIV